jgi:hypothetical protein
MKHESNQQHAMIDGAELICITVGEWAMWSNPDSLEAVTKYRIYKRYLNEVSRKVENPNTEIEKLLYVRKGKVFPLQV